MYANIGRLAILHIFTRLFVHEKKRRRMFLFPDSGTIGFTKNRDPTPMLNRSFRSKPIFKGGKFFLFLLHGKTLHGH
jgi:hypothetical protein